MLGWVLEKGFDPRVLPELQARQRGRWAREFLEKRSVPAPIRSVTGAGGELWQPGRSGSEDILFPRIAVEASLLDHWWCGRVPALLGRTRKS